MFDSIRTVQVHTSPAYTVSIGSGLLQRCGEMLRETLGLCRVAVITDSNVAGLYLPIVEDSLRNAGFSVRTHVFPLARPTKTWRPSRIFWSFWLRSV